MCHQAVGLIQSEIERRGIATAGITMLPRITRLVGPPRTLSVPFRLGFQFGPPEHGARRLEILRRMLSLLDRTDVPFIEEFRPPTDDAS